MGVPVAAANRVTIAAAGGVEAIVQGMQAHVGVAGVQDNGAAALWFLAASGTLWHYFVVALCSAWCTTGCRWRACVAWWRRTI